MEKIKIAIAGYGNLGRGVECAVNQNSDMELVAVFTRRDPSSIKTKSGAPVYPISAAKDMQGKIDGLQILSTERKELQAQMRKEFSGMIGKEYEELMRVKDKGTKANFYIRQQGELIKELIMLADTEENFSVIQLKGNFTLQDIQEITNESSR